MKLLRLRTVRRPPLLVTCGDRFDVALSITTDLGEPFVSNSNIPVKFELVDSRSGEKYPISVHTGSKKDIKASGSGGPSNKRKTVSVQKTTEKSFNTSLLDTQRASGQTFSLQTSTCCKRCISKQPGHYHSVQLIAQLSTGKRNSSFSLNNKDREMLQFIGEYDAESLLSSEFCDDLCNIAVMKCCTESFKIFACIDQKDNHVHQGKVQNNILSVFPNVYMDEDSTTATLKSLKILEKHDVGLASHVWDASLVLSLYLLGKASRFFKKGQRLCVVELGSGCALSGILTATLLNCDKQALDETSSKPKAQETVVICTDLSDVIESRTQPNIDLNLEHVVKSCVAAPLDWEQVTNGELHLDKFYRSIGITSLQIGNEHLFTTGTQLVIIAGDVLYNTSSHVPFLETLIALFDHYDSQLDPLCQQQKEPSAIIAYKSRMHGDFNFFNLARECRRKFVVEKLWVWNDVTIFKLS